MNNKQAKVLHTVEHKHKQTNKQIDKQKSPFPPTRMLSLV